MKSGIEVGSNKYMNLHQKIIRKHGNAIKCDNEHCNSVLPKRFEWALKHGHTYSDNIEDYMQLCPSCHRKYDYKEIQGHLHSIKMKGRKPTGSQILSLQEGRLLSMKQIDQFSKQGVFINSWVSITTACNTLGISNSAISNNLKKNQKQQEGLYGK